MATVRLVVSLLGLAVIFSVFAGTYYAPENVRSKTDAPSLQLDPGDTQQQRLLPGPLRFFRPSPQQRGQPVPFGIVARRPGPGAPAPA